jgi:hypothetical protein
MEASEVLALIEKIIEEHRQILQEFQVSEQAANDAVAMRGLGKGKDAFMPGRLDQKQGLGQLSDLLNTIEKGLDAHFQREENSLPAAVMEYGSAQLVSDVRDLLQTHKELRRRLIQSKADVAELVGGGRSRHMWEASAHDMRAHLTHTRKLLEEHAMDEQQLLHKLRGRLQETVRENA